MTELHTNSSPTALPPALRDHLRDVLPSVVDLRRDLHAHPETSRAEHRTTAQLVEFVKSLGLVPQPIGPTGIWCDINPHDHDTLVAFRADIDALPILDETDTPWSSKTAGVSHACGHDVHTAIAVGVLHVLKQAADMNALHHGVRVVFQPAEESMIGGAVDAISSGVLSGISRIAALHCDPALDVGRVGMRVGPITSASDVLAIRLSGTGGHTSRPHLTADVVYALGHLITALPGLLTRRIDPRGGVSLVWGRVNAGAAPNAIPRSGSVEGTLRCLRLESWEQCAVLLPTLIDDLMAPYGVDVDLDHTRGVPPVVNDADTISLLSAAGVAELGPDAIVPTPQSLGGEDFAHYLQHTRGAMVRLGTRKPGGPTYDLHRGDFDVDERSIEVGIRLMANYLLHYPKPADEGHPGASIPGGLRVR